MLDLEASINSYLTAYLRNHSSLMSSIKSSVMLLTTDTQQAKTLPPARGGTARGMIFLLANWS